MKRGSGFEGWRRVVGDDCGGRERVVEGKGGL